MWSKTYVMPAMAEGFSVAAAEAAPLKVKTGEGVYMGALTHVPAVLALAAGSDRQRQDGHHACIRLEMAACSVQQQPPTHAFALQSMLVEQDCPGERRLQRPVWGAHAEQPRRAASLEQPVAVE